MKKNFVHTLAAFIILLGTVSLAQEIDLTEAEELRLLKQHYRTFLIAQQSPPTEAEEMKLIKQNYGAFLLEQSQTAKHTLTEAEEMRLVKQDYRAFLLEQRKIARPLAIDPTSKNIGRFNAPD